MATQLVMQAIADQIRVAHTLVHGLDEVAGGAGERVSGGAGGHLVGEGRREQTIRPERDVREAS